MSYEHGSPVQLYSRTVVHSYSCAVVQLYSCTAVQLYSFTVGCTVGQLVVQLHSCTPSRASPTPSCPTRSRTWTWLKVEMVRTPQLFPARAGARHLLDEVDGERERRRYVERQREIYRDVERERERNKNVEREEKGERETE